MKLLAVLDDDDTFVAPIAETLRGRWCRVSVAFPRHFRPSVVTIRSESTARDPDADTHYLDPSRLSPINGYRSAIAYIPDSASTMRVAVFGYDDLIGSIDIRIFPLSKLNAGVRISLQHPGRMLAAAKGELNGLGRRVRATMAIATTGRPPGSYDLWIRLFDTWTDTRTAQLMASGRRAQWPSIEAHVCPGDRVATEAQAATLTSLERQIWPVTCHEPGTDGGADYVAVVQAGEVIPRHGMALLADWVAMLDRPDAIYADEDSLSDHGRRYTPIFKPQPNHTLMLSGTLATGVWLIRRSLLASLPGAGGQWAAALRLETWLRLHERDGACRTFRVPFIVTHRRDDCQPEPAAIMARIVEAHLHRISVPARVNPTWPIAVQPLPTAGREPHVTIVVPSACRSSHVAKCLLSVATTTSYPRFDIVVVLSQKTPADTEQLKTIAALEANERIRVVFHRTTAGFNYAVANNFAVGMATGSLVCLLNDDVEPIRPDWLINMVGHFSDPCVGIVGAKLYYSNDQVQHGGVILGLAGLCDHVNRFLPRSAPGYASRAVLDQQLSAVTAACLVTKRSLYAAVGGMDERYASAFNDIDFCLKAGAAGRSVIFSAHAELYHYESMSFGQHYTRAEVERWAKDVALMRDRWRDVVTDDPFHNPNLSLQRGHEWEPAYPPRLGELGIARLSNQTERPR